MSNTPLNNGRRRFLTATTTVVGGIGAAAVAVPFIQSWNPSARTKAAGAPVEVDMSKLQYGQMIRVEWQGKPVWIVRRTQSVLDNLSKIEDQLRDPHSKMEQQPDYAHNEYRSIKPEFFVAVGFCTHLGCSPTYLAETFSEQVQGVKSGFFCPCHGSSFDMAGRVFQGGPAPLNLVVPRHKYLTDTRILIGTDEEGA